MSDLLKECDEILEAEKKTSPRPWSIEAIKRVLKHGDPSIDHTNDAIYIALVSNLGPKLALEVKRLSELDRRFSKNTDKGWVECDFVPLAELKEMKEKLKEAVELLSKFGHGIAGRDTKEEAREFITKVK